MNGINNIIFVEYYGVYLFFNNTIINNSMLKQIDVLYVKCTCMQDAFARARTRYILRRSPIYSVSLNSTTKSTSIEMNLT